MKTLITAALTLSAASFGTFAAAQQWPDKAKPYYTEPTGAVYVVPPVTGSVMPGGVTVVPDGRALGSDREVGEARRAYRASCNEVESGGFCECLTAGVAQALAPAEVRIAARTIRERITAQGDSGDYTASDATLDAQSSVQRIDQIEGHYADACAQFRS